MLMDDRSDRNTYWCREFCQSGLYPVMLSTELH